VRVPSPTHLACTTWRKFVVGTWLVALDTAVQHPPTPAARSFFLVSYLQTRTVPPYVYDLLRERPAQGPWVA